MTSCCMHFSKSHSFDDFFSVIFVKMFVGITLNSGIVKQVNDYNPHGHKVRSSKDLYSM